MDWIISWNINNRGVNFLLNDCTFFFRSVAVYILAGRTGVILLASTPSNDWAIDNPIDYNIDIDCLGEKGTARFDIFLDF